MNKEELRTYHREWARKKRAEDPVAYAEKRRLRRLANYETVREQEKKSRAKNIEKHRNDSRERMKEYRKTPRYKEVINRHRLKKKYGLTEVQHSELFTSQGNACAVCKSATAARWHIDHDHTTGLVRGILCQHCNLMLGHALDNPTTLRLAANYLER